MKQQRKNTAKNLSKGIRSKQAFKFTGIICKFNHYI